MGGGCWPWAVAAQAQRHKSRRRVVRQRDAGIAHRVGRGMLASGILAAIFGDFCCDKLLPFNEYEVGTGLGSNERARRIPANANE